MSSGIIIVSLFLAGCSPTEAGGANAVSSRVPIQSTVEPLGTKSVDAIQELMGMGISEDEITQCLQANNISSSQLFVVDGETAFAGLQFYDDHRLPEVTSINIARGSGTEAVGLFFKKECLSTKAIEQFYNSGMPALVEYTDPSTGKTWNRWAFPVSQNSVINIIDYMAFRNCTEEVQKRFLELNNLSDLVGQVPAPGLNRANFLFAQTLSAKGVIGGTSDDWEEVLELK
jgi:hypothetical protein